MLFRLASLAALLAACSAEAAGLPKPLQQLAIAKNSPAAVVNGMANADAKVAKDVDVNLTVDGGWYKFYFAGAGEETAYTFTALSSDWLQFSITDAYCSGDSFDLYKDGKYLLTTPRVTGDSCKKWTDDPDKAFANPLWSSTKFSLQGSFNITLKVRDSPWKGGAAFVRADSHVSTCRGDNSLVMVTAPLVPRSQNMAMCARVGGVPAHLTPANTDDAIALLNKCGWNQAWFGKLSLAQAEKAGDLGCLALSTVVPDDPTVDIVDCNAPLPVLCEVAGM